MNKKLLRKLAVKKSFKSFISDIENLIQSSICIKDETGKILIGNETKTDFEYPIKYNEQIVGWVSGERQLSAIAELLSFWLILESEKISLGKELLDRYREITFYFNITEQLAGNHEPKDMASFLIEEAQRIIKGEDFSILLMENTPPEFYSSVILRPHIPLPLAT